MPARHLYVHVPFCARRCSYCDFAIAVRRVVPVEAYLRALHAEIETRFSGREREEVETIYLGGGTPSRLGAEGVERLLALLARYCVAQPAQRSRSRPIPRMWTTPRPAPGALRASHACHWAFRASTIAFWPGCIGRTTRGVLWTRHGP